MIKVSLGSFLSPFNSAFFDKNNALRVYNGPINLDSETNVVPFRQYFTSTGASSGSNEMAITTGTLAAPVSFWVPSHTTRQRVISRISFFVSGSAASLNEFGTGTALTNGCRIYYQDPTAGDVDLHEAVKSNFDLVRLCDGQPSFGSGTAAFQVSNAVGTDEAFIPVLDIRNFVPPYGIRLEAGSTQKIVIDIRDNTLTAKASSFNAIAYGFEVLPK